MLDLELNIITIAWDTVKSENLFIVIEDFVPECDNTIYAIINLITFDMIPLRAPFHPA